VDNNRRDVSEIRRFKPDGARDVLAGGLYGYADGVGREARFGPIGAIAVGPGGDLYVTDEASIRKVTPGGRVSTLARGGPLLKPSLVSRLFSGRFGKMMGLAVDARGEVFAANYGGGRVVQVSPAGKVTSVLESSNPWSPSGVALAGTDIYVLEFGTIPGYRDAVRVRRRSPDGTVRTLAVVRGGRPEGLSGPGTRPESTPSAARR
jgi:DNA-binding beta-propeller fold protein YncE